MPWQSLLQESEPLPVTASLSTWFTQLEQRLGPHASPWAMAVLGGRWSATPGLAFLAGYQAALRTLWPSAPAGLGALCVTENRSTRPADLSTRVQHDQLNGRKDFVTAGEQAQWLLVAARAEAEGEPIHVRLAYVAANAIGVQIEPLPTLAAMPDISHARVQLCDTPCQCLAGDGWSDYVKPFRTLEDTLVLAAVVAWLYGVAQRCQWSPALGLSLVGVLAGCAQVHQGHASAATTHVLLAGVFAQFEQLRAPIDQAFAAGPEHWQQLWTRHQAILGIARKAREARLSKALTSLAD